MLRFKNKILTISLCLLFLIEGQEAVAQILPGDADNNGKVENVDFLYIGFGYGETGAARLTPSGTPVEQAIQVFWSDIFPTGLNFAFADSNGDGLINYLDFLVALQNYGTTQPNYSPPIFFIDNNGVPFNFETRSIPPFVTQGTYLELPLILGPDNGTAQSFNGVAFTIEYNTNFINNFTLDFSNSWLGNNMELFQIIQSPEDGKIEVALTRLGNNAIYGNGEIGRASFVIEDDLAGWLAAPTDSIETSIKITKVAYKAANFETRPIQTEDVNIMLHHPDALLARTPTPSPKSISIAPNPTNNSTTISSDFNMNSIEIYDISGRKVFAQKYHQNKLTIHHLNQFGNGLYFIKINTIKNQITKKLLIQN